MSALLTNSDQDGFTIELSFKYSKSMLEGEKEILKVINDGRKKMPRAPLF